MKTRETLGQEDYRTARTHRRSVDRADPLQRKWLTPGRNRRGGARDVTDAGNGSSLDRNVNPLAMLVHQ